MANILPILDSDAEDIKNQLIYADALRKKSLDTGGQTVGGIYVAKNPWQNFLEGFAGSGIGQYQRGRQADLEQQQLQERQNWLGQMPSATETRDIQQASPEQAFGPTQAAVVPTEVRKSPRALQQAMTAWGMNAPRGMEGVQNYALQQAMLAPEKQAEAEQRAADRMQELQIKMLENRATQQEKREFEERMLKMQMEGKKDLLHVAAALRPTPAPHTQIAYDKDGKGYLVDMRTGAQSPLENIGKVPGAGAAGAKLPIQAQKMQSALQNLESGLNAYETLLKQYNPQNLDALTPEKRAALSSAFGDLRMQLKGAYELGAITGPDMQVLEGVLTDPTGALGMAKGVMRGSKSFDAQISQVRAALNRQKRNFEQQYNLTLPEPAGTATAPMPGVVPKFDPDKEARYQEWLRSQNK